MKKKMHKFIHSILTGPQYISDNKSTYISKNETTENPPNPPKNASQINHALIVFNAD